MGNDHPRMNDALQVQQLLASTSGEAPASAVRRNPGGSLNSYTDDQQQDFSKIQQQPPPAPPHTHLLALVS